LALGLDAFESHGHRVTKNFLHGEKRWASETDYLVSVYWMRGSVTPCSVRAYKSVVWCCFMIRVWVFLS